MSRRKSPQPLTWVSGNLVYARSMRDVWALFSLPTTAHGLQGASDRESRLYDWRDLLVELGRDVQLLRVHRWWDPEDYQGSFTGQTPHEQERAGYLAEQAGDLDGSWRPGGLFLCVALQESKTAMGERAADVLADPGGRLAELRAELGRLGLGWELRQARDVEADHAEAESVLARVLSCVPDTRPASLRQIEWLVRRAWTRGLGEPDVDGVDEPRALIAERNGRAVLRPSSVDVLGWTDYLHRGWRHLEAESELGRSWQAGLAATSMVGDAFAGDEVLELFNGPQDELGFGIDLALTVSYVSPRRASRKVNDEMAKADEAAQEQHEAARGVSEDAMVRVEVARDAESYLNQGTPLFESTLTVMVAAGSQELLTERTRQTIARFRTRGVNLRVPVAQQLEVLFEHLPGQRTWTRGFTRRLTAEQIGAMAPQASHRFGGTRGYVLGIGDRSPIAYRWSPEDGSRLNTATGVLSTGDAGSGKTTLAAKTAFEAFLDGAVIFDFTGKSDDHHWHKHPLVAEHTDVIELRPGDPSLRGLLDPWRNAPQELRAGAARSFLESLLPHNMPATWETALTKAVTQVDERVERPTNGDVLACLRDTGDRTGLRLAEHLEAQAASGLAQLGFAARGARLREVGERQVTHVEMENLPVPGRGVSRDQYDALERQGSALAKLVALLGLGVLARYPDRPKLFNFDEVKILLDQEDGRKIIDRLQRLGRSKLAVPLVQTQYASDIGGRDSLGALFGTVFCFRAPDAHEAELSCRLVGIEPAAEIVRKLSSKKLPSGRALARDHRGQVEWVQVKLAPSLRERVNTNPTTRRKSHAV